jgi:hypothetical protein
MVTIERAPVEHRDKPGVCSEAIPLGVSGQKRQVYVSRVASSVEELEHFVVFTETGVHQRHRERRNIANAGKIVQHRENVSCRLDVSVLPEDVAP